jgi:hypothetical protein
VKRLSLAILLIIWLPGAASAQNVPTPSPSLLDALATARSTGLEQLVTWAPQILMPAGPGPVTPAETKILALLPSDRDAILYWLNGHGRAALHAQGAADADIGVPYYPIDYAIAPAPFPKSVTPLRVPAVPVAASPKSTPAPQPRSHFGLLGALLPSLQIPIATSSNSSTTTTTSQNGNSTQIDQTTQSSGSSVSIGGNPWEAIGSLIDASANRASRPTAAPTPPPWRSLPFAMSAQSVLGSQIAVNRGFAAVRNDGTEGVACISFVNQSPKAAAEVDVDIEILDGFGFIKRVRPLRRVGTFASGAEVGGPSGPQTIGEARANCVIDGENRLADLSDPFSNASAVAYSVRRVLYADGTSWLQPGANPWAS